MNERIKELSKQAVVAIRATRTDLPPLDNLMIDKILELRAEYDKKFAELIVKECAKVVNDTEYPYENQSYKNVWDSCCVWSASKLKEHFGVE